MAWGCHRKWSALKIQSKLKNLKKKKLKNYNQSTFGNVLLKKEELLHFLQNLDRAFCVGVTAGVELIHQFKLTSMILQKFTIKLMSANPKAEWEAFMNHRFLKYTFGQFKRLFGVQPRHTRMITRISLSYLLQNLWSFQNILLQEQHRLNVAPLEDFLIGVIAVFLAIWCRWITIL